MEALATLRAMKDNELGMLRQRVALLENLAAEKRYREEFPQIEACPTGNCIQRKKSKRNNSLRKIAEYVKKFPGTTHRKIMEAMEGVSNTREYIGILVAQESIREIIMNREKHYYPL